MNKYMLGVLFALSVSFSFATAKEQPKQQEKLVCDTKANVIKTFEEKKFFSLLNMTNKEKVVETIWVNGTSIAITAASGDTVCLLAMMDEVVYNSDTITGLYKVFEAQLNKEKGI